MSVYLRVVLAVSLSVGIVLSSNSRIASHDVTQLAKIVAEHHTEIEEHGHAHEDVVDVVHAYHGHAHDVTDHDHNVAFLSPRTPSGTLPTARTSWGLARYAMPDRNDFDLDRPPRA